MELNDLQQQRLAKLERLRAAGIEPYPPRAERTHTIAAALADFDGMMTRGERVTLTGRIVGARRVMGKLAFAHIADESGKIQLWVSKADLGDEWFARFRDDLDTFDIVQATGTLRRTKTGEPSLFVERMARAGEGAQPAARKVARPDRCRGAAARALPRSDRQRGGARDFPHPREDRQRHPPLPGWRGFIEVETPTLQPIYGGASARPFVTHHNQLHQDLYLRIADELYLKRLIVGGFETRLRDL